jgi:deaminated glutathione amidase
VQAAGAVRADRGDRPIGVLTIATCQFPVSADITANLRHIKRQMDLASQRGARVAHFPEGALSGYAGTDFPTFVTISTLLRRRAT